MIKALVQEMLQRPDAWLLLGQMQHAYDEERRRREDFYRQVEENRKMEFINGEIFFESPVRRRHNAATGLLFQLVNVYVQKNKLGFVGIEKLLISLTRNDYEPDLCFFGQEKAAGLSPDQHQFPAPDWVAEVLSPSTEAHDRGIKFTDYAAHGVSEYWIIDPDQETVEQYRLSGEAYELLQKSGSGELRSFAIAGFQVPVRAIFDPELNIATLAQL